MLALRCSFLVSAGLVLVLLAANVYAGPVTLQRHFTLATLHTSINCPKGNSLFAASNEGLVRDRSAHEVWAHVGDWCNARKWRDLDVAAEQHHRRHECDNAPGSLRAYGMHGTDVTERLDLQVGSPDHPKRWETWFAQASSLVGRSGLLAIDGTHVSNVHVLLKIEQAPNGARVGWTAIGCSTDTAKSRAQFEDLHGAAVARLESHFR